MMHADRCKVPPAFWRAVDRLGVSRVALLRQACLPALLHIDHSSFVTTAQSFALWRALENLTCDVALGIKLVVEAATDAHPPSSLAAFYARDYRDGLHRLARFKHLCTPEKFDIVEAKDECLVAITWLYAAEPAPAVAIDAAFATIIELGRRGTGHHLSSLRLEFSRSGPGHDEHKRYFGCSIRHGAPRNAIALKKIDLDRPFPGHNPELLEILTPSLAATLGELQAGHSTRAQVKVVLKQSLASGRPDLVGVANTLGMSERTLQRRMTDEGATFRDLLVEARQELGHQLLADPAAGVEEIACLLGYQDTSSFYRAFRDWEGTTPNRWRALNGRAAKA